MRPPFPGMDPWLEHPTIWPDVHNRLIAAIADVLVPMVDPRYFVGVESRMVLYPSPEDPRGARPDLAITRGQIDAPMPPPRGGGVAVAQEVEAEVEVVEVDLPVREEAIEETYLEIRDTRSHLLVTILEILSPSNKSSGRGREAYLARREEVLETQTNLVEIDLLRDGEVTPTTPSIRSHYRVLVSRSVGRPRARVFAWNLRTQLPDIPIPLLPGDAEPILPLNATLHDLIDRARFFRRLDYEKPPFPLLSGPDMAWVKAIVAPPLPS
ncbi:DUF4058 family protein [Tautonia rosea]|uniref:DUF4058 family protein n=1 Tax=Tautonia rosea TaxID=2728037 RepID=UPI00147291DD|nr:DUF4058 family protein [Tautonia rosea]